MNIKAPAEYQIYLAKQNYPLRCSIEVFDDAEIKLLNRYGFWIEALVSGRILPTTEKQKRLIAVNAGGAKPISLQECAWRKLVERRIWEQNERDSPH